MEGDNGILQGYIFLPKVDFFSQPSKIEGWFLFPLFSREVCRSPAPAGGGIAPQAKIFFEDRLGYPAISMDFKTESFTYM